MHNTDLLSNKVFFYCVIQQRAQYCYGKLPIVGVNSL